MYLLDSNAVIACLNTGEQAITSLIVQADAVYLSAVVVGELLFGALASGRTEQNLKVLNTFISENAVLIDHQDTARVYADVRLKLKRLGRPIPENDLWIAATAIQHNLMLVTRDAHFSAIELLSVRSW